MQTEAFETRSVFHELGETHRVGVVIEDRTETVLRWNVALHRLLVGVLLKTLRQDPVEVRKMTLVGHGVSRLPDFFVKKDIEDGRLVHLLTRFINEEVGIYLVYARERHRNAGVQAVIDFVIEELAPADP
ncbi:MAG: hypothetical protein GY798_17575 [Hyphomicrobiales bacterium]|nr:hypothetical protein [Hyphomicrobiales bacterium]